MTLGQSRSPLVSIGLPTFNRAALLDHALAALLCQTYKNLEITVVDNASTDDTRLVVKKHAAHNPCLQYHCNALNIGPLQNLRRALQLAHGDYFMWASDDDLWAPTFISTLVEVLEDSQDVVLAMCEARYIDPDGDPLPMVVEGSWFSRGRRSQSATGYVARVVTHSYGNLFYGLYRMSVLRGANGQTALDGCRSDPFNELPVFVAAAAQGSIRVVDDVLFFKRTTISTFAQAAAERNAWPLLVGSTRCATRPRRSLLSRVVRSIASDVRYHWNAWSDTVRALASTQLLLRTKVAVGFVLAGWLIVHVIKVQALKVAVRLRRQGPTPGQVA